MPGSSVGVFITTGPKETFFNVPQGQQIPSTEGVHVTAEFSSASDRELEIYERLSKVNSTHQGQSLIRELSDSFELQGPVGKHRCLVLQPMHMTLLEMMRLNPRPFDILLLKMTVNDFYWPSTSCTPKLR